MQVRYSGPSPEAWELELQGTKAELRALRDSLVRLVAEGQGTLRVGLDTSGDPRPYDGFVAHLVVEFVGGPVLLGIDSADALWVKGGQDGLGTFSSYLELEPGDHLHFEYIGFVGIHEASAPIVISCREGA